jgi:tRNA(fMet)-specific endonuclease VapC
MKEYLLDTNIVVALVRYPNFSEYLKSTYPTNSRRIISVVTQGEAKSLTIQWKWGASKLQRLEYVLSTFIIYPIKLEKVIHAYAQIDAFSQGKLPEQPLPVGMSARNMGKNDLWNAATANATGASLLTTDTDFNHLHSTFLDLNRVDIKPYL